MSQFYVIIWQDWMLLRRQAWAWFVLLFFFLIAWFSITMGNRTVSTRLAQIDTIQTNYQKDLNSVLNSFSDTLTAEGRQKAKMAGKAFMINYKLPQNCFKVPLPLSALSLGVINLQPWQMQVQYTKDFSDEAEPPISHPFMLYAGSIDFSFVLIYLLPLLTFLFTYSIYSEEKTSGTLPLLTVHSKNIHVLLSIKFFFRFIILAVYVTVLIVFAFMVINWPEGLQTKMLVNWILLSIVYLLVWTSVAYAIVMLKKSANVSLLMLCFMWILVVIVMPAAMVMYVQSTQPLPMKDEIASYRRQQSELIWNLPPKILADTFNRAYPAYLATINLQKDTLPLSDRYVAGYYYLLEQRMNRVLAPYLKKIENRNNKINNLLQWNPSCIVEKAFTNSAATDFESYRYFNKQVDSFQKVWQRFLYDFYFNNKDLDSEDIRRAPSFHYVAKSKMKIGGSLVFLFSISICVVIISWIYQKRYFLK